MPTFISTITLWHLMACTFIYWVISFFLSFWCRQFQSYIKIQPFHFWFYTKSWSSGGTTKKVGGSIADPCSLQVGVSLSKILFLSECQCACLSLLMSWWQPLPQLWECGKSCKVLWVVNKTRKALYKFIPFTVSDDAGECLLKIIFFFLMWCLCVNLLIKP